jgi:hypothetical protein
MWRASRGSPGWVTVRLTTIGYQHWLEICSAASPGELTTHDLRHFYASALIAGGASVK